MLNKTVLVIERDPDEARRILQFFESHNFRNPIEVVCNKSVALDYLFGTGNYARAERTQTPGLILLDLKTNRTSEADKLRPLQSYLRTQNIPIVILTSSEEQEKEVSEFHLGAVGFIRKPLEFTHFIEVIQHMGMRWQENKQPSSTRSVGE